MFGHNEAKDIVGHHLSSQNEMDFSFSSLKATPSQKDDSTSLPPFQNVDSFVESLALLLKRIPADRIFLIRFFVSDRWDC